MASTDPSNAGAIEPVMSVNTANLAPASPRVADSQGQEVSGNGTSYPEGTNVADEKATTAGDSSDPSTGTGVDGELEVWQARYSMRNFIGRIGLRVLLAVATAVLAYYTWGAGHENLAILTWVTLGVVVLLWVGLVWRIIMAHYSHYYRLTNRRLFVSTGVFRRHRDMLELLRVKDVHTNQDSLMERWLGLGTVVVEPTEKDLPKLFLVGVDEPKEVMDLIWHHARAERDHRSVKVDGV